MIPVPCNRTHSLSFSHDVCAEVEKNFAVVCWWWAGAWVVGAFFFVVPTCWILCPHWRLAKFSQESAEWLFFDLHSFKDNFQSFYSTLFCCRRWEQAHSRHLHHDHLLLLQASLEKKKQDCWRVIFAARGWMLTPWFWCTLEIRLLWDFVVSCVE